MSPSRNICRNVRRGSWDVRPWFQRACLIVVTLSLGISASAVDVPVRSVQNQSGDIGGGFVNAVDEGLFRFTQGPGAEPLQLENIAAQTGFPAPRRAVAQVRLGPMRFNPNGMLLELQGSWLLAGATPGDVLILPGTSPNDSVTFTHPGTTPGNNPVPQAVNHQFTVTAGNSMVHTMFNVATMQEEYDVEFQLVYGCSDNFQACTTCPLTGVSNFASQFPVQFNRFSIVPEPSCLGPIVFGFLAFTSRWRRKR